MKPEELVKKTKLDRITGTRTVTRYEGAIFGELSEEQKKDLEIADNLTGKTLYQIEHGASLVRDLFEDNTQEIKEIINDSTGKTGLTVRAIDISGDFMLYQIVGSGEKSGTFRWWSTQIYMDVKRVDLPFLRIPALEKNQRIYIVMTSDYRFYKFPKLLYPTPIKDFFKWLKKKKKISITVKMVFDRNENIEGYPGIYPKRNIKEELEISEYIKDLEEYDNNGKSNWKMYTNLINKLKNQLEDITITQEDINDYISEAKNRYKIYR